MSDQCCGNCYYRRGIHCRLHPPVRLPRKFSETRTTLDSRMRDEEIIWGWPEVRRLDWCGDHLEEVKL
jgi:hypothetical protein